MSGLLNLNAPLHYQLATHPAAAAALNEVYNSSLNLLNEFWPNNPAIAPGTEAFCVAVRRLEVTLLTAVPTAFEVDVVTGHTNANGKYDSGILTSPIGTDPATENTSAQAYFGVINDHTIITPGRAIKAAFLQNVGDSVVWTWDLDDNPMFLTDPQNVTMVELITGLCVKNINAGAGGSLFINWEWDVFGAPA